jgi:hypothetical protein
MAWIAFWFRMSLVTGGGCAQPTAKNSGRARNGKGYIRFNGVTPSYGIASFKSREVYQKSERSAGGDRDCGFKGKIADAGNLKWNPKRKKAAEAAFSNVRAAI